MSKYRQAARVDDNQAEIVRQLRRISGITVELGHDDILVGYKGKTYWFEIKDPKKTLKKNGEWKSGAIKDSQIKLALKWRGHYEIVHNAEQILKILWEC